MKRRALLSSVGAAATTAIAGCSALSGGGGGDGGSDSRPYDPVARWALPADVDSGMPAYGMGSYAPADTISEIDHVTEANFPDRLTVEESPVWGLVGARSLELAVTVRSGVRQPSRNYWIYEGEFEPSAVAPGLGGQQLTASEVGTHEGFTIYEATAEDGSVGRLYALTNDTLIEYRTIYADTPIPGAIEAVVDVGVGESETLLDQYDAARSLAGQLSPNLRSDMGIAPDNREPDPEEGVFSGLAATGSSAGLSGDLAVRTHAHAFQDTAALDEAPIDEWIDTYRSNHPVQSTTTATSGRVHVTTFELPVEEVFPRISDDGGS